MTTKEKLDLIVNGLKEHCGYKGYELKVVTAYGRYFITLPRFRMSMKEMSELIQNYVLMPDMMIGRYDGLYSGLMLDTNLKVN